jgi:hypothetical protein
MTISIIKTRKSIAKSIKFTEKITVSDKNSGGGGAYDSPLSSLMF